MTWNLMFFVNSIALGIGLAMDAFSVSLADGLNEPNMSKGRMSLISGTFALFQFLMPLTGWIFVHTLVTQFKAFEGFIPWIALALLGYIGGKMLYEGITNKEEEIKEDKKLTMSGLALQGVATSIDALSVGFTIENYDVVMAAVCSLIIGVVTFFICIGGLKLGRKFGMKLSDKAAILGGVILIAIGIEIFVTGIF